MAESDAGPRWRTPMGIAAIGFTLVAAFYLLREHYAHVVGTLPYLILLACPLMHLLMHRGHDHGHRHGGDDRRSRDDPRRPASS